MLGLRLRFELLEEGTVDKNHVDAAIARRKRTGRIEERQKALRHTGEGDGATRRRLTSG